MSKSKKKRSERKSMRQALNYLQSGQRDSRVIMVIFESSFEGPLPEELIDQMTPEKILIAANELEVEELFEQECLKRHISMIAQEVLLDGKTPERFVQECEMLGFKPSKKAADSFSLKLLEALCFINLGEYNQDDASMDVDLRIYSH